MRACVCAFVSVCIGELRIIQLNSLTSYYKGSVFCSCIKFSTALPKSFFGATRPNAAPTAGIFTRDFTTPFIFGTSYSSHISVRVRQSWATFDSTLTIVIKWELRDIWSIVWVVLTTSAYKSTFPWMHAYIFSCGLLICYVLYPIVKKGEDSGIAEVCIISGPFFWTTVCTTPSVNFCPNKSEQYNLMMKDQSL